MTAPRVWAPRAAVGVDLVMGGDGRLPMRRAEADWWIGPEDLLHDGVDYAFAIDGGMPRPDPRSPWQPNGVHGPSRWVDHGRHSWSDAGWRPPAWRSAVVEEIHVGTFTPEGTFEAAIGRLDDLVALGISHVQLMPVADFPGRFGWGYDGVDLFAPRHAYGGPDGLKRFVDAAHARGLAVMIDVVYNHFGPDGNYLSEFGPYTTDRHHSPWGDAVNLDGPGSDEVRRFFVDNALMWLRDYHADGLRLDAVQALNDLSAVHVLEQLTAAVDAFERSAGRDVVIVAESDLNDPRLVRPRDECGYGVDAQWSDEFRHALHVTLTGERSGIHGDFVGFTDLCTALRDVYVYTGQHSAFRGRSHGRPLGDVPRDRFVAFLQNHDQVGNRATGERSSHLVDMDALKVAAALVVLGPNVPLLFQGEEWGASTPFLFFADHEDPRLARAVRDGRRREFPKAGVGGDDIPDPGAVETFQRSKLDWSERDRAPHAGLLDWHRRLVHARRAIPSLAAGAAPDVTCDERARTIIVRRPGSLLAVNLGESAAAVDLGREEALQLELASRAGVSSCDGTLDLVPMSAALLLTRQPSVGKPARSGGA